MRHAIDASRDLAQAVEEIQTFVRDNIDPDLDVRITGGSVLTSQAADQMASGQAQSLGLMLVIIFLIVSVLFMNPSAGLLALVPNLIPIIVLFGIMGYLDIPLDTGTAMIAAISIGISVDDTIHFMTRYHQEMRQHPHSLPAIQRTMDLEATPIAVTSIALMLGFAALGLSGFPPVMYFGLLSALVILLALIANFVVTPLLLSHVQLTPIWELLRVRIGPRLAKLCPVFQQMGPLEMRKVLIAGCPTHYPGGELVFRPGDPGEKMYVVLDGQVEVRKTPEGGEAGVIETLGPGEVFGVTGLATNGPRLAEAVTREDTELLALDWETLRCIGALSPRISAKLHRNLCVLIGRRLITELQQAKRCGMNLTPLLEDLSKRDHVDSQEPVRE